MNNFRALMVICLLGIGYQLGIPRLGHASTSRIIYVATDGSDTNPGTASRPMATPQHGLDLAASGDTILLKPGVYHARLQVPQSGTPGNPITLQGEPGAIIDAGEQFTTWQSAPEVGKGVYKNTHIPFVPYSLLWNDQYILHIRDDVMQAEGFSLLKQGPEGFYTWDGPLQRSWDGIEALWGTIHGTTYIRFRNNQNPNNENVMLSPHAAEGGAPITIDGQSDIVIRNLTLRNGDIGIYLTNSSSNIIIEHNMLIGQHDAIGLYNGTHDTIIRNNAITLGYIHTLDPSDALHWFIWYAFKVYGDYDRTAVLLYQSGRANTIHNNHIFEHWDGISDYSDDDDPYDANDTDIYNNTFDTLSDSCYEPGGGDINQHFHDNILLNCNTGIRIKSLDQGQLYLYRNIIYSRDCGLTGEKYGFFISHDTAAHVYVYHNSVSTCLAIQVTTESTTGAPNIWYLNNIFSSSDLGKLSIAGRPPHFDHNWVGGDFTREAWMGTHNIFRLDQHMWNASDTKLYLSSCSSARGQGIDLSQRNVINTVPIPAMPGLDPGYYSGAKPDLGARQYTMVTSPTPTLSSTPTTSSQQFLPVLNK